MEIISTGYKKLDDALGGGLIKGSTNLVIEDPECLGDIFLVSLLKRRVAYGDTGLVDCFSYPPAELKRRCKKYDIDLYKYPRSICFINLSSIEKIQLAFDLKDLSNFADRYVSVVSKLFLRPNIFNIVLSFTAFTIMFGEEQVYNHLIKDLKTYEAYKRTAVYLIQRPNHTEDYVNKLKPLCSSVIVLKHSNTYGNVAIIEKSPLPYTSYPLPYRAKERMTRI